MAALLGVGAAATAVGAVALKQANVRRGEGEEG